MPVTRPEDMAQSFAEAFNSGNVDAVLALYESNAVLVAPPGQLASGIDAIREALQGFLALKGKLAIESRYCIRAGDTALTSSKWALRQTPALAQSNELPRTPDGKVANYAFEMGGINQLYRSGWKKEDLPIGAEVTIDGYLSRTDPHVANSQTIFLADGRKLVSPVPGPTGRKPEGR